MKINRQKVHSKYDGVCAYCGERIAFEDMQIDHIVPKFKKGKDDYGNFNPACRKCNHFKGVFTIEQFRIELWLQVDRLYENTQFQRALRYNQIKIERKPIVFYFETLTDKKG